LEAPRPKNDEDPEIPGLKIVVQQSFKEIVLDETKYVFLDISADWCGPSVQMKPEWHALANLLKDISDIVIAYMDGNVILLSYLACIFSI
jgi:thiol-disulfide isomerase/thioredoxin